MVVGKQKELHNVIHSTMYEDRGRTTNFGNTENAEIVFLEVVIVVVTVQTAGYRVLYVVYRYTLDLVRFNAIDRSCYV